MLSPVGNAISLQSLEKDIQAFDNYHHKLLNSGTSALTLSLLIAKLEWGENRKEVIIPAYCCPDLVTACIAANVTPVLCDIGFGDPGYDLNMLESLMTENTLAVIAVNFLGIRERLEEIHELTASKKVALIEDDAQWFPETTTKYPLKGDLVCLSFGRGKPVSLLGGGAILIKSDIWIAHKSRIDQYITTPRSSYRLHPTYLLTVMAYNVCLLPPNLRPDF